MAGQEDDGFREANLMLANALKQLDEALNNVTPSCTSAVPRRKSWYRSRSSPASHILTQSGLIYSSPTTKLNKISEEEHKQMSEHAIAPLAVTPFNGLYLDDNSNQCHPSPPRQFQSFSPPLPNKTNNGTAAAADTKTLATTTSSITHADMHQNGWQKIEEDQQDVINGNHVDATGQLDEDTFANGHSVHSSTKSLTHKSPESVSPVRTLPPITTSSQVGADMESSEKEIWVWSANNDAAEDNANVEDCMESGAESSVFGAESPPSVHQSSSSSTKPADVHLNRLIKAIDEEKLAVPDSGAKMKILKWLSFSSDAPPIGAVGL